MGATSRLHRVCNIVNNLSVIIPSKTRSNFEACEAAVIDRNPSCRIILVDDGITPGWRYTPRPTSREGIAVDGDKPFVFSRNVNLGIVAAGDDDVIILNDDALLRTPRGFSLLQQAAYDNPEFGIIASTTNIVGNRNQCPQAVGLREEPRMVCFVCVFIPRRTIDQVGLLDERFVHYGCDDDDYSLRVRNAGLKIGIHDGCFVDHGCLPSTYRGAGGGDYSRNLEIFKQKWGMDNGGVPA